MREKVRVSIAFSRYVRGLLFFKDANFSLQGYGNKSITLYDIRAELNSRYKDLRSPYHPPSAEETFSMLTKETPETFYRGKYIYLSTYLLVL